MEPARQRIGEVEMRVSAAEIVAMSATDLASLRASDAIEATGLDEVFVSSSARKKAKSKGQTMSDGSFPIRNVSDLKKAIQAYGRAKNKAAAKAWIVRSAKRLGRSDLIPSSWKASSAKKSHQDISDERALFELFLHDELPIGVEDLDAFKSSGKPNALERYWKHGKGAAKIRWTTPGDWTRCHRHLTKYVGNERAKRICAQWHHDMNGYWPGDKKNNSAVTAAGGGEMETDAGSIWTDDGVILWDPDTNDIYLTDENGDNPQILGDDGEWTPIADVPETASIVDDVDTLQQIFDSEGDDTPVDDDVDADVIAASGSKAPDHKDSPAGRAFKIGLVIPEGISSGDGRTFSKGSLEFKEPPIPLLWQKTTDEGHRQSVIVGKITSIDKTEAGLGNAQGVFDTHPDAVEAARQVENQFLTGVSGDVDQFKAELSESEDGGIGADTVTIHHGRLVAATLVAKPAFQECSIEILGEDGEPMNSITASGGPVNPPLEWFSNPKLTGPTHLEVTDDGHVFGHIATWESHHIGNPALRPPRSKDEYSHFCTGQLKTAEGVSVRVGQLTLTGGHADLNLNAERAIAHYDDTRSAIADVSAGEDEFGIWVAGSIRPNITEAQLQAFRASDPSGDWRPINGHLELVAVCQVNCAGFPVPRTLVAGGEPLALVAAGAVHLNNLSPLEARLAMLERRQVEDKRRDVRSILTNM